MSGSWVDGMGEARAEGLDSSAALDRGLLDRVYRKHWDEICRYLRRTFGAGPPEPEDVAQATFARFAAVADPGDVANPRAFLFRTAHNIAIDARRKAARGAAVMSDPVSAAEILDFSPEDVLVSRDELGRLENALADLKPKHRAALLMHRLDGLSFAEIARRLGVSPSGAKNLVERAFELCMAAMEKAER